MAGGITDYNQILMNKYTHFLKIFLGFAFFVVEVYHVAPSVIAFPVGCFRLVNLSINLIELCFRTITPLFCFQASELLEVKFLTNDARKALVITRENIPHFVLTKPAQTNLTISFQTKELFTCKCIAMKYLHYRWYLKSV